MRVVKEKHKLYHVVLQDAEGNRYYLEHSSRTAWTKAAATVHRKECLHRMQEGNWWRDWTKFKSAELEEA